MLKTMEGIYQNGQIQLADDRKTQYFKITIWSIALQFGIAIALLISILIVMPRVRYLSRAIAPSQVVI
jgi:hypothetical protein